MGLFNFNDEKSRKQVDIAHNYRHSVVDQYNADNLAAYLIKKARRTDDRDLELDECMT